MMILEQVKRTGCHQLHDRHVPSIATDGVFVYVLDWRWGLTKHGTGMGNTNPDMCYEVRHSVALLHGVPPVGVTMSRLTPPFDALKPQNHCVWCKTTS
jgi:hypothetical protein